MAPPGRARSSWIRRRCPVSALSYYYRDEGRDLELAPTDYRPLPDDPAYKKALVAADRALLRLYTFVKGRTRLSDRTVDRLLRRL